MKTFSLTNLVTDVEGQLNQRIQNALNNLVTVIDEKDSSGFVRITVNSKTEHYYGTDATKPKLIRLNPKEEAHVTHFVNIIHKATADKETLKWFFAKLSRAKSIGSLYSALPSAFHKFLPASIEDFEPDNSCYDQKCYEILQQLEMLAYLEG